MEKLERYQHFLDEKSALSVSVVDWAVKLQIIQPTADSTEI